MKSLKLLTLVAILGAGAATFSGCSSAQKAAAGTGLAGGITGAVVGNNWVPVGPYTGAVVGASGGAAVGGLVGDAYDQVTEADMERELKNLRAELAALQNQTGAPSEATIAEMDGLRGMIGQLENELASLRTAREAQDNEIAALRREGDQLRDELANSKSGLDTLQGDVDRLNNQKQILESDVDRLMEEANRLRGLLDQKEDLISDANSERSRLDDSLAQRESELDAKNRDLAALESDLDSKARRLAELESELDKKARALDDLQGEMQVLRTSLDGKDSALSELRGELDKLNVELGESSRGLTLTIVNSLLYDAGSSELSTGGRQLLGDVAKILNERFPKNEFVIEGHTDNQPIVHSGWRSNWELGAARSLNILHELVNYHGIDASRVSATSFGEFRPKTTNATAEGRRDNRRAVIVIVPEELDVQRKDFAQAN